MIPFGPAPRTGNERDTLLGMLNKQRAVMLWKLEGLTEEQARLSPVPSGTSLLGMVKHLADVERWWFVEFIGDGRDWTNDEVRALRPDDEFVAVEGETIASISQGYADAVAQSDEVIARAATLDVTGSLRGEPRSLRWVLGHMIEETARHAGHADIIRELVDGVTGYFPDD